MKRNKKTRVEYWENGSLYFHLFNGFLTISEIERQFLFQVRKYVRRTQIEKVEHFH